MERVDVAYAFLYDEAEEKVLMVNNVGGRWSLPGGAVEKGEKLKEAVIREVYEETGLTVQIGEIVSVNECIFHEKGHHAIFFTFRAEIVGGNIAIQDESEIAEIKWVPIDEASQLMPYHPGGVESLLRASSPYVLDA